MKRIHFATLAVLALAPFAAAAAPLTLDEALRIAETRSSQLAAQRAAADAASALVPAARENPDPKLLVGVENLPVEGADRWNIASDFMTMRRVGVMQDFVRGEKRELQGTRAEAEARREQALVEMRRAELRREVATAWLERHYAERMVALVESLEKEARLQAEVATAELAAGKTPAAEGIAARALVATLADRRIESERMVRRATAMLTRWLGEDAARPLGADAPSYGLDRHTRGLETGEGLEEHPELGMYAPMEAMAEAEMRLAAAAKKPDWSVELSYAKRGSIFGDMVSVMFRMDLPLLAERRQDPVTRSKAFALEQVRAQAEDARRRHLAEVRVSLADWEAARERLSRHRREIVPLAEERAKAALSGYAGGRTDLAATLEARRGVVEARMSALGAEAELARAWAQLAYLLPERKTP
jgi:outer membrane protein TolC